MELHGGRRGGVGGGGVQEEEEEKEQRSGKGWWNSTPMLYRLSAYDVTIQKLAQIMVTIITSITI